MADAQWRQRRFGRPDDSLPRRRCGSIERDAPALRLFDDEETKILSAGIQGEDMQVPVLHFGDRHANNVRGRSHRAEEGGAELART